MKSIFVIFVIVFKLENSNEVSSSGILKDDVIRKAITRRSDDGLTWQLIRILVDEKRERKQLKREFIQMKKILDNVKRELEQRNENLGDIKFQRKKLLEEVKSTKGEVISDIRKYLETKLIGFADKTTKLTKSVTEIKMNGTKMEARIKKNSKHGKKMKESLRFMRSKLKHLEDESSKKQLSGAIYIRWGKLTCPNNTELIYAGRLGGTYYSNKGGPSNLQCLPDDPDYREHQSGGQGTYIYGGEYEIDGYSQGEFLNKKYHNYDVVCAACQSRKYATKIMIPGKSKCYDGWQMEYMGYLMGGNSGNAASNFICVDAQPDFIPGTNRDDNQARLYTVESRCGSLNCPPYKNYYELTCVVCTR